MPGTALIRLLPAGRPTQYRPEYNDKARRLAILGATDDEIADQFGIHRSTLYDWKRAYPDFADAIKEGKIPADTNVAHAMYDRAMGAVWTEEQAIKVKEIIYEDGKRVREIERIEIVEVTRRAPPDTTAGIFYLKNRRPKDWRDKHEIVAEHDHIIRVVRINGLRDGDE